MVSAVVDIQMDTWVRERGRRIYVEIIRCVDVDSADLDDIDTLGLGKADQGGKLSAAPVADVVTRWNERCYCPLPWGEGAGLEFSPKG